MIAVVIVGACVAYVVACVAAGFGPAGSISEFRSDGLSIDRRFRQDPATVLASYAAAVARVPGMRLAETTPDTLLVDLRPTSRILGGNFGLVMRLTVGSDGPGTVVRGEARRKVRFALGVNDDAAFVHAERALRTRAKGAGLDEVIPGVP